MVGDADAPQLHVVDGRDRDLGLHLDAMSTTVECRKPGRKTDRECTGSQQGWLSRGRPDMSAVGITDVAERAVRVAGRVFAPSRERQTLPATESTTLIGDHGVVAAVRQQLQTRRARFTDHGGPQGVRCLSTFQFAWPASLSGFLAESDMSTRRGRDHQRRRTRFSLKSTVGRSSPVEAGPGDGGSKSRNDDSVRNGLMP